VIAGAQSCFPLLAAEPLPAARERVALAPPWTTSPLKTRVGVSRRRASGRLSRRRRVRSMFTPGSRACGYRTASGRAKWPNRDPIAERGFQLLTRNVTLDQKDVANLYSYVRNDPAARLDYLGLKIITIPIKLCHASWKHYWHSYFDIDGKTFGFYPKNDTLCNEICGPGQVVSPDPAQRDGDKCSDIWIDDTWYDPDAVAECIRRRAESAFKNQDYGRYSVFWKQCHSWVADVIRDCERESIRR